MKNDYGIRDNLFNDMINEFKKTNIEKVILFGSKARNDYKYNSDINLAIIFTSNDNYIKILTKLENLNTLYKFDIIDYNKITNIKLKDEIDKDGKIIYIKKSYIIYNLFYFLITSSTFCNIWGFCIICSSCI